MAKNFFIALIELSLDFVPFLNFYQTSQSYVLNLHKFRTRGSESGKKSKISSILSNDSDDRKIRKESDYEKSVDYERFVTM